LIFSFTRRDAQASNIVITSIISICSQDAHVLFYPGATHSFVSSCLAPLLGKISSFLNETLVLATLGGDNLLEKCV